MVPTPSLALSHFAENGASPHAGDTTAKWRSHSLTVALWHLPPNGPLHGHHWRSLGCAVTRRVRGSSEGDSQARKGWRKVIRGWFFGDVIFVEHGGAGVEPRCGAAAAATVGREVGQRGRGSASVRQQKREQHQPEPPLASSIFSEPAATPSHYTPCTPETQASIA